jgi:hypothetical protein
MWWNSRHSAAHAPRARRLLRDRELEAGGAGQQFDQLVKVHRLYQVGVEAASRRIMSIAYVPPAAGTGRESLTIAPVSRASPTWMS